MSTCKYSLPIFDKDARTNTKENKITSTNGARKYGM